MKMLFFSSDTCKPCEKFKPILEEVRTELNVEVEYIYRERDKKQLGAKYYVQGVPTMICLNNEDKPCWSFTGTMTKGELRTKFIELQEIYQ